MSKGIWGYAAKGADGKFTEIESGIRCNVDEIVGILLNRADYSLEVLEVPKGTDAEVRSILEYRVRSLHPSPEKTPFDWIVLSKSGALTIAVITIAPGLLERYKQFDKPLAILFQMLVFGKNSEDTVYAIADIGERFRFTDGHLQSVLLEKQIPAQTDLTPKIRKGHPSTLFSNNRKSSLFTHRNINILLAAAALLSFLLFLWRDNRLTENRLKETKAEYGRLLTEKNRLLALDQQIKELRENVIALKGQQKGDVYIKLSAILGLLPAGAIVDDLEISEAGFRLRLRSSNPVSVIEDFHNSNYFDNVNSSGIQGIDGSDLKLYTITGDFNG